MKRTVLREYRPLCEECEEKGSNVEVYCTECDHNECECLREMDFNDDNTEAIELLEKFDVFRMTSGRIFHVEKITEETFPEPTPPSEVTGGN